MTDSSLQDRLREHAKAFDSLLSLIPAKMYYGEDNSDQWNRKKQTKAEAKAARMNKLDPDSDRNRNAKEIMDERAKSKRKLRELQEAERSEDDNNNETEDVPGIVKEEPGEGLKRRDEQPNKKQKRERPDEPLDNLASVADENPAEMTQEQLMKAAKRDAQRADRKAKQEKKAEKRATKAAAKEAAAAAKAETAAKSEKKEQTASQKKQTPKAAEAVKQTAKGKAKDTKTPSNDHDRDEDYETVSEKSDAENDDDVPAPKAADAEAADSTSSSPRSASHSPVFDAADASHPTNEAASTTTSTSSTVPPSEKPKQLKIPHDTSLLKARLAARIAELQAARKAIGPDGKPIRTRQELIESQRARQAQRKAKKTEQRRQAKLEEERQRDEALASNSPSIMSPALDHLLADDGDNAPTDYSFGRVAFNDHTRLSRDLTHALNTHKKKGPSDPKTALLKLQNQRKKQAALDAEKQADVAEKESWLTARRRAEGERIQDDESMLKKAVKRKDKQKKKSEKEWKERAEGVTRAVEGKQRKREENLKKRKDEKKLGKAGKKLKVKMSAGKKKGGRPGFEGSFGMGGKKQKK